VGVSVAVGEGTGVSLAVGDGSGEAVSPTVGSGVAVGVTLGGVLTTLAVAVWVGVPSGGSALGGVGLGTGEMPGAVGERGAVDSGVGVVARLIGSGRPAVGDSVCARVRRRYPKNTAPHSTPTKSAIPSWRSAWAGEGQTMRSRRGAGEPVFQYEPVTVSPLTTRIGSHHPGSRV